MLRCWGPLSRRGRVWCLSYDAIAMCALRKPLVDGRGFKPVMEPGSKMQPNCLAGETDGSDSKGSPVTKEGHCPAFDPILDLVVLFRVLGVE